MNEPGNNNDAFESGQVLFPIFANIPQELQGIGRWGLTRLEITADPNRPTKPFYTAEQRGHKAAIDNPASYRSFEQASQARFVCSTPVSPSTDVKDTGYSALGLILSAYDEIVAIDLDNKERCPQVELEHQKTIALFDSYTERSPSGTGYRIFLKTKSKAALPAGRRRGDVEAYCSGRYVTVTGHIVNKRPIEYREELLAKLFYELGGERGEQAGLQADREATLDDATVVAFLSRDPALAALYGGDTRAYGGDTSAAEQALCNALAARSGNRAQVERIWLASPLGQREKTQNRADYRKRTIEEAFDRPELAPVNLSGVTANGVALKHGVIALSDFPWVSAGDLRNKHFEPVSWVVPGIIPQGAIILGGRPKLGKSWAALEVGIAVAEGGTTFGKDCDEGDVLYAALEDTQRRLKSRMWKLKGDTPWPKRLNFMCELPRADEGGVELIRKWLEQAENPRLVIVDTLAKVRPGKGRDEGNYDADYRAVTAWKDLADEFNIAIVLVHHVRKLLADDPLEMISGTNGLTGAADAILILNRSSQGCTLGGRGRDLEEFELAISFNAEDCRWNVLGNAADVQRSSERNLILGLLTASTEPLSPKQISHNLGMNDDATRQMLSRMVAAGELIKAGRGAYTTPCHNSHSVTEQHIIPVT